MEPQPPVTAPQPTPPLVPPKPKNNNFLIILLSVLLLLATSLAGFFALQTQKLTKQLAQYQSATPSPVPTATSDETANWKVYKDQKYEFKYPDYWKSQPLPSGSQQLLSLKSPTETNISFSLVENIPGIGLECEVESKQQKIDINQLTITKIFTTGIKSDSCGDNSGSRTIWAVLGKNINDYLIIRYNIATVQIAESIFDQILSTFRFTE